MADDRSWLVTGASGMLGRDLVSLLRATGADVHAFSHAELDITDPRDVAAAVSARAAGPTAVVVNLAAWTNVDGAEESADDAWAVNAAGARNVAGACARSGARMIQLSTDYVFDGTAATPYPEDAPRSPASAYGRTKAEGELAVLENLPDTGVVLRTAWLYGAHGRSFVRTMVRLAAERETLDVVDDQTGQPTWTVDLARRIIEVGEAPHASGVFHATNAGSTTWFGLARAVFTECGLDPERVRPTTTDRFPRPAARPAYSVLGHERWAELDLEPMRPWREALSAAAPSVISTARR